jgi:hypothetical protein
MYEGSTSLIERPKTVELTPLDRLTDAVARKLSDSANKKLTDEEYSKLVFIQGDLKRLREKRKSLSKAEVSFRLEVAENQLKALG